ncbi:hypothetical protein ACFX2J_029973 [Malus domestica]
MPPTRRRRNSSSCHQPGDEIYSLYYPSSHQPGDEIYNLYSNIIWQLAIHATPLGDEMYNPYFPSCHQPGEEGTYLHATNQVMKCTTCTLFHATNQVKKELIFMPPTR